MTPNSPTKAYRIASFLALATGVVAYIIGLFNAQIQLNEKGYYLIVLLYGLFSAISLQKTIRDQQEQIPTNSMYYFLSLSSTIIAITLLAIGLYNADLFLSEKGFYIMAFVLSLFSAVTVQKNIRDSDSSSSTISSNVIPPERSNDEINAT